MELKKIKGLLQLARPANVVTAASDVLAGVAISGFLEDGLNSGSLLPIVILCLSSMVLYAGGVMFNDVFDAKIDAIERPERPIPRGTVTLQEASVVGFLLLVIGVLLALSVGIPSGVLAILVAVAAVIYNKYGKHHSILGPINMGLCRGLNLLLGVSVLSAALDIWWGVAFIPIVYIAAVTMVSRGEVYGGDRRTLYFAAVLYLLVIAGMFAFAFRDGFRGWSLIFILPFAGMIFPKLRKAIRNPLPENIGKAVKAGVLALILMNAAWAALFGSFELAIVIVLLLPISLWLAKLFAVT